VFFSVFDKVFELPHLGLFLLIIEMDNWRKNQGISNHHQVGHWRSSSSYKGKPPLG